MNLRCSSSARNNFTDAIERRPMGEYILSKVSDSSSSIPSSLRVLWSLKQD